MGRMQLVVGLAILILGGGGLGGEYVLVKWYPGHRQRVIDDTLKPLPYRNDELGIEMQVAAGLYGKVEDFPGGARIFRPMFWSVGPTLTITSQPNPDRASEFAPETLAKWESLGANEQIPDYHFERTKINNRDAVLIEQYKGRGLLLTGHVISPDRLIEADCSPGTDDPALYLQACDRTLRTIKVAGPEPPAPSPPAPPPSKIEVVDSPGAARTPPH